MISISRWLNGNVSIPQTWKKLIEKKKKGKIVDSKLNAT